MPTLNKAQLAALAELRDRIRKLVDEGASFDVISAELGLSRNQLARHLVVMKIKLSGDKRASETVALEDGAVAKDDGKYMAAVRRLSVAPPENLSIIVRNRRPLPARSTIGSAGCAAALCADAGDKTRLF
jgi:hypothetical protein